MNQEKTIKEVKEAKEKYLMTLPGVTGVAIGLKKGSRERCIKVYVDRGTLEKVSRIPKEIEGYPVEVETMGTLHPL